MHEVTKNEKGRCSVFVEICLLLAAPSFLEKLTESRRVKPASGCLLFMFAPLQNLRPVNFNMEKNCTANNSSIDRCSATNKYKCEQCLLKPKFIYFERAIYV